MMDLAARRMKFWLPALAAVTAAAVVAVAPQAQAETPKRPNVLVIVADDMGYSDLGAFGGEIATPNLDALAVRGVRLTGFHTAPTCSPTRAMLLTGADNHEVGLGTMAEMLALRPAGAPARPGYEGYLSPGVATLGERLQQAGYTTLMAGKWHLGLEETQSPKARGFDRSYVLLNGGHDHFGDDQKERWVEAKAAAAYREDGALTVYPVGRYSSDVFTDKMLAYLDEAKSAGKPFFAYLAYTEPHWPLQAPAADIAKYKGRYDEGYEVLRERRLARMKALGLIDANAPPHPMTGVKPWAALTAEEKAISARKMEIYAGMVDHMDRSVGRVIAALKANGQYDNTLIIFMSDNGPEGTVLEAPMGTPGPETLGLDNSLARLGGRNSFAAYGPAWAQAASAPARGVKGAVTEGGIRTAAFVAGPGVQGGRIEGDLLHVMDITPTVLDVTGAKADAMPSQKTIRGRSWTAMLQRAGEVRGPDDTLGWEFSGSRAFRHGDWKVTWLTALQMPGQPEIPPPRWALYDLKADPGETHDLGEREPERLKAMIAAWEDYARQTGVAP